MNIDTMTETISKVVVKRVNLIENKIIEEIDEIANEVIVNIYTRDKLVASVATSPHMFLELGLGYALTHGLWVNEFNIIVKDMNIVISDVEKNNVYCSDMESRDRVVDVWKIYEIFKEVMNKASLFKKTGCFHVAAAVFLDSSVVVDIVEDISRHCALYKVVGKVLRKGLDFNKIMIIMSSRAASELVESIAGLCIPIAVFRGAPTSKAIEIARKKHITLIAHVRENRMNIYSGFERIAIRK